MLASLTQDEVLSADEYDELSEEQKSYVEEYMADLRNQFPESSGGKEAFDLFVQQFRGYVAAQYLGDPWGRWKAERDEWCSLQADHRGSVPHPPLAGH